MVLAKIITRIWHGTTALEKADRYLQFLLTKGTEDYKKTPGNLSIRVWRRIEKDKAHFWTVTTWKDLESVKAFAGENYEKAVYYPEDDEFLLEFESEVLHCETYEV
jgi:heme-degrading monooxygenase HmoA